MKRAGRKAGGQEYLDQLGELAATPAVTIGVVVPNKELLAATAVYRGPPPPPTSANR